MPFAVPAVRAERLPRGRVPAFFASLILPAAAALLLLAAPARAQNGSHAFHRDASGRQWVVVSDAAGSFTLRRFDSGGALAGEVSLSSAAQDASFAIASGPDGDAWVSGGASDGGTPGFGVWHVSADGLTMISSAAIYGDFDIYAGGVAVDASSRAWVTAPQVIDSTGSIRFALWRFEQDGSLSSGFPKYQRRAEGVLDGALSVAVDSSGDVWSAGVSLAPGATAYDLALWRYDQDGNPRNGFPVYRGSAYATLDEIEPGIVIAAGDKVWVTASQLFPGCGNQRQQALFRFDLNGTVELQRYWHNAEETASNGRSIALASDGSPWVLGRSSNTPAVWSYDRFGGLEPGYPRTDESLDMTGIALDAGDAPWVVYGSTPGAFVGALPVGGAEGLPSCAQLSSGTIEGSVIVEGGAPAGSSVTIVASPDGFQMEMFAATFLSTGGASVPFTIELPTAGDYAVGAFVGDNPDVLDVSTPIGFYRDFTPVSLAPGGSAAGVDFTIALDTVAPVVALSFPVAGSTVAALPVVEGSGYDANGVGDVQLAVQDLDADLWYDPNAPGWSPSASPVYRSVNADVMGPSNAVQWSVAISSVDNGNFGRLDERLVQGHHYRVLAFSGDFVGHESIPAETTFTWDGPTGSVGPQAPSAVIGQALGVSSIAWSWNASQGATAYFLASSSYTTPFASVTTTSYISEGLLPAETRMLCVAGVNLLIAGDYSCSTAETHPAVPGAVAAAEVFETSVTWSWTDGGNSANARFELSLSTDGFVAHVSTPSNFDFGGTSYTAQGLAPNTVYAARVRAYNLGLKFSDFSPSGSTRTSIGALQAPYNVTALFSRTEAKVTLSWTAPDPAPASYRVYRGTEIANLSLLGGTTDTAYADFPAGSAFYFYAVSALGDLGGESPISGVQSVRFDATPPSVSFVQPADGETLSRPYTVIANASDDFTSAFVRFDIDGIARATTTVSHQFFWDVRAETDGPHTLAAVATDDDGNQTSISRSVTVAYSTPVPPTVIVPSDGFSTLATTFTVQGYAPLLTGVSVYADAVFLGASAVDASGQWSLPEAAFQDQGDYLLRAFAFEARGESYASAPLRVAYFAQPPAAPGAVSAAVDRQTGLVELMWGASAGTTPVVDYRVERATAADGEYLVLASTPTTAYIDFPGAAGDYHYRVRAAHGSGLLSAFVSTTAAYDLTPPAAIIDLRFTDYRPQAGQLDLAWTAPSDDFSGVARQLLVSSPSGLFDADSSTTVVAAQAPGSTVTATSLVGAGAAYYRVYSEDAVDNRSYASNTVLFDPVPPVISAFDLNEGAVVSRPRYLTPSVTDNTGVVRVDYRVDGSLFASSSQAPFDVLWNLVGVVDGARTVGVTAFDAFGSSSTVTRAVTVNYMPPSPPVVSYPADGFVTNSATVSVSGTAPAGTTVQIQIGGVDVAAVQVGPSGSWYASFVLPAEGELTLTALAFEPRGFSGPSAPVHLTYTTTAPNPPVLVQASLLSGGRAKLTWQAGPGKAAASYAVYRSTDDLDLIPGDPAPAARLISYVGASPSPEFTDYPPADDLYFYAVTARDGAGNESLLSDAPYAFVDRTFPSARVTLTTAPVLGPGAYPFTLTLSEVLSAVPVLTFTPQQGSPAAQTLDGVTGTVWRGTLTVTGEMNPGIASFAFEGRDLASNVGTVLTSGATVALDTRGPVAEVSLSRASPINAGALGVTLTLDEPAASAPSLSWTPNGAAPAALTVGEAGALDGRTWTAELTAAANTPQGEALFTYSATDALGNVSSALTGAATSFMVDTAAPNPPILPHANPAPGGVINLSWSGNSGELPVHYRVLRDAVQLTTVAPAVDRTGAFADFAADGPHDYLISAIDAAGNASADAAVSGTADSIPPVEPQSLAASLNGFSQIQLTWTQGGADTANYRLYRATFPITTLAGLVPRSAVSPFIDSPAGDGTYRYVVTARDAAGNESVPSNTATQEFDQAAPTIEISGVENGEMSAQDLVIAFTVADANLNAASIVSLLDGQAFASGSTVSIEGPHTLSITATDFESHSATVTVTFTLDKTAPALSAGVAEGALLVGASSFTVSASDLHLAASSFLLVNDTLGSTVAYRSGDLISRDGAYRLFLSASDEAGNEASRTISFSVDAAPGAPLSLAVKIADAAALTWTAPEADVVAYRVYRDASRISSSLHAGTSYEDVSFTSGAHIYEVSAVDARGLEGPKARATVPAVTLGLSAPTLTRGFFDALTLRAVNASAQSLTVGPALAEVIAGGVVAASATANSLSVPAGQTGTLPAVVATPVDLAGSAAVRLTLALPTDQGSAVSLTRLFAVTAAEPVQPLIEALPDVLLAGGLSPVRVRLYNRGSASMDIVTAQIANSTTAAVDDVTVRLRTTDGAILASAGIKQTEGAAITLVEGRQIFFVTVPPGGSLLTDPVLVPVPGSAPGSLSIEAAVSTPTYDLGFVRTPGRRGFTSAVSQAVTQQLPYRALVAPQFAFYDQGSSVTLSGTAFDASGSTVANSLVAVRILSEGYDRRLTAVTNTSGAFTTVFNPLPNEAGLYSVSAFHPSAIAGSAQSTFTIVGFSYNYTSYKVALAQNSSFRFEAILKNIGSEALTGIAITTPTESGTGLSVVLDNVPVSLAAGAETPIGVTISASPTASSGTVNVIATEQHGYFRTLPVIASVSPAVVIPVAEPQQFLVGVLGGETRLQTIVLRNQGFDTWRDLELSTPSLSFVTIQGPPHLGDIPPGGNVSVTLAIAPSVAQPNQTYNPNPLLQVLSANMPALPILGSVAVTSTRKGGALVSVINADKPRTAQGQGEGIPGANVTLISLDVSGITFKVAADLNGVASFSDIPSGNYVWRAESSGFQAKSGTVVIEPGVSNIVEAILVTSVVTYEWKVTPTTIQDKYTIALQATFKTDVPAPVLVTDPPLIDIKMVGGQTAYSQFTITNRGLIKATKVKVNFAGSAAVQVTLPFTEIPEILPGQSVVVPVKLYLVHASCEGTQSTVVGTSECAAGNEEERSYPGLSFLLGNLDGASCGGGGGISGGGGGGGVSFAAPASAVAAATPGAQSGAQCSVGPKSGHKGLSMPPLNPSGLVDILRGAVNFVKSAFKPNCGSPGIGLDFRYLGNGSGGEFGLGWAADFGYEIRINPDGTYGVKGPDGSDTVYAPVGDILQPLNGDGPLFARPVNVDRQLGNPSPATKERNYCQVMRLSTTLSYHGYTWNKAAGGCGTVTTGDHFTICPGPDPRPDACGSTGMIAAYHEITTAQGETESYEYYNSTGAYRLTRYADRNGSEIRYIRNNEGRVDRIQDSHGRFINLVYNGADQLISATDWAGRVTAFEYDPQGRRILMRDPIGDETAYAYDAQDRMTQITYPNGGHTNFVYDASGKVIETNEDAGVNRVQYASYGSSATVTDALGHTTKYETIENNGLKRFSKIIDPADNVTTILYDEELNPREITDPLGRRTQIQTNYNADGSLATQTRIDALGNRRLTSYARGNFPTSASDAKSNLTYMGYDDKRNLIQVTDAQNNSTRMSYDSFGHVVGLKDALGNVTSMAYNNNGALTSVTDPLGRTATTVRDNLSRATAFTDPANKQTAMSYDLVDNVTQVTDALSGPTVVTYEKGRDERLPKTVKDAKLHTTTLNYDLNARVASAVNALGQAASITYDNKSRPERVTTRNNHAVNYTYDNLDRLTRLSVPEGNIDMTYDAVGRMLTASGYNGTALAMTYDAADRVTEVVQTLPNAYSVAIGYGYDANGNRTSMATPWGSFSYTYDNLDRVTSITNPYSQVVTFAYDALGRRTQMNYPNGTKTSYAYDAAGQIVQVLHQKTADQTAIAFTNYTYDASGNRTGMTDMTGSHAYEYDQLNRLTVAQHPALSSLPVKTETFIYDAVGNRTVDAERTDYIYNNSNRIISNSSFTYTTDANGNMTSKTEKSNGQTTTFIYDSANRLIQVNASTFTIATYKYDLAGNRIEKSIDGIVTRFVYDGADILAILNGSNDLIALFTHGPGIDSPLSMRRQGVDFFYHADALGNVNALTGSTGNISESYEYLAFGLTLVRDADNGTHSNSLIGNPFLFTSRELDDETGLYYYRARHYDQIIGRFLQEDPITNVNQYAYAANNPVLMADPLGLCPSNRTTLEKTGDYAAGFGDTLTSGFGLTHLFGFKSGTEYARDWMGTNDYVSHDSGQYLAGQVSGYVWASAMSGALAATATETRELKLAKAVADHQLDPGRRIPLHYIEDAINYGTRGADPRKAAGAYKYSIELFRSSVDASGKYGYKKYILDVIYNPAKNMVYHAQYFHP